MPLLITDPVDWRKDPVTGDLLVPLQRIAGLEGVAQRIGTLLQMIRGEYVFNRIAGMPWIENDFVSASAAILAQGFSAPKARAAARAVILSVDGVYRITALTVSFDGEERTMSVNWAVSTIWGVPLSGTTAVAL